MNRRQNFRKEPLYRKENRCTHGVWPVCSKDYRHLRNTKQEARDGRGRGAMHGKARHGYDYTPLFRFLLSKVGEDWGDVYSEARSRLDHAEPIFWMVATHDAAKRGIFSYGESTFFSGLYVNERNQLALVDPDITIERLAPYCPCCTHTFNGKRFKRAFDGERFLVRPKSNAE